MTVNYDLITAKIRGRRQLPLTEAELGAVNHLCAYYRDKGNLCVLGDFPDDPLRTDYLDVTLDPAKRGHAHFHVTPDEWRAALVEQCDKVVNAYFTLQIPAQTAAVMLWRGAKAFAFPLFERGVRMIHADVKRNGLDLSITWPMPPEQGDVEMITRGDYLKFIIPDVMLASGSSTLDAISFLKSKGVDEGQIAVLCIIAAPEGVFSLLQAHPRVKIMTVALDECLDEHAYIVKGLGDAGDKWCAGLTIEYFEPIRQCFTDTQWQHLKSCLGTDCSAR